MIGASLSARSTLGAQERLFPSMIDNPQIIQIEAIEQGWSDQHLVEHVPEVDVVLASLMKEGTRRSGGPIAEPAPHRVVEEGISLPLDRTSHASSDTTIHSCVQTPCADNSAFKRIHVEAAHHNCLLMAGYLFRFEDFLRKSVALLILAPLFPVLLVRQVDDCKQDFVQTRRIEPPNRPAISLVDRPNVSFGKSSKNRDLFMANGLHIAIFCRCFVQTLEQFDDIIRNLRQQDHIDIIIDGQIGDLARRDCLPTFQNRIEIMGRRVLEGV